LKVNGSTCELCVDTYWELSLEVILTHKHKQLTTMNDNLIECFSIPHRELCNRRFAHN